MKSICQSKKLAGLKTDGARLLYTWLLPNLDINGCFSADVDVLKGHIFTRLKRSPKLIRDYLKDLADNGLIITYQSNGDVFLCVPDFTEKQPSLNPSKEAKPTIPPPTPEQLQTYSRLTPLKVKESKDEVKVSKEKKKCMDFVYLTEDEYKKLVKQFGEQGTREMITNLNLYIGSKGDKYKSHYHTILSWERKNNLNSDASPKHKFNHETAAQVERMKAEINKKQEAYKKAQAQ